MISGETFVIQFLYCALYRARMDMYPQKLRVTLSYSGVTRLIGLFHCWALALASDFFGVGE